MGRFAQGGLKSELGTDFARIRINKIKIALTYRQANATVVNVVLTGSVMFCAIGTTRALHAGFALAYSLPLIVFRSLSITHLPLPQPDQSHHQTGTERYGTG